MSSLTSLHHGHTYNSGMKEDPGEVLSQTKNWRQQINMSCKMACCCSSALHLPGKSLWPCSFSSSMIWLLLKTEYPFLQLLKSRIHGICRREKQHTLFWPTLPSFSQLVIVWKFKLEFYFQNDAVLSRESFKVVHICMLLVDNNCVS